MKKALHKQELNRKGTGYAEMKNKKYKMRIVEGALINLDYISQFSPKELEYFDDEWKRLLEVELTLDQIREVQKIMIKHYETQIPWYMDGHATDNKDEVICAFGADDGEDGRIFIFRRDDKKTYQEITDYAVSKGIPKKQVDFL